MPPSGCLWLPLNLSLRRGVGDGVAVGRATDAGLRWMPAGPSQLWSQYQNKDMLMKQRLEEKRREEAREQERRDREQREAAAAAAAATAAGRPSPPAAAEAGGRGEAEAAPQRDPREEEEERRVREVGQTADCVVASAWLLAL